MLVGLKRADGTAETVEAVWVIGAGGAHSVTRESMAETLAGTTYPGTSLVASGSVECGLPRDGGALIAGPEGWVLLLPLPGGHWLTFIGDLDEGEARRLTSDPGTGTVGAMMERRVGRGIRVREVAWAARSVCTIDWSPSWPTGGASCWVTPGTYPARSAVRA